MHVAVVGAGVNGLASARALARSGVDVVIYEQYRLGHTRGSSHGRTRIYRVSYPEARWVRLAQQAIAGWRELEAETGERLLEPSGLLEVVGGAGQGSQPALDEVGIESELLDRGEVGERFGVTIPDGALALFQDEAGTIYADRAQRALLASARAAGVRVVEETRVENLDELEADAVVVTAGSWAKKLLAPAGVRLDVTSTRETVGYFRLDDDRPVPSVVDFKEGSTAHGTYALSDPLHGLKVGIHKSGPPTDPDEPGLPDEELVGPMRAAVERYFPRADPDPVELDTCLYTRAEGDEFILERHGRIVVGSACSGHGFKFAPAVGERLAALALETA